jgi:AcrR family transcriptional regulator
LHSQILGARAVIASTTIAPRAVVARRAMGPRATTPGTPNHRRSPMDMSADTATAPPTPVFFEAFGRLPPGRHSIAVEEVARQQRMRLMGAMLDAVGEQGYIATSVADVLARAGISRRTFYEHFCDKEDCYLQAYDHAAQRLTAAVTEALASHERWEGAARTALDLMLRTVADNPRLARACLVEVLAVGPAGVRRRDASLRPFQQCFDRARALAPPQARIPETVSETIVGGILETISARVLRGETARLPELLDQLMFWSLVAFLGPVEAGRAMADLPAGD